MPRDEYDDGPPLPGTVKVAGVIWIFFGGMGVLAMIANLASGIAAGANMVASLCPACVTGAIAAGFIHVGLQSVRGLAKDTLGNGIGSIGISLFYFGLAALVALGAAIGPPQGGPNAGPLQALAGVMAVILGGFGALLLLAGVLALVGRSQYRKWREFGQPTSRSRRRRRERDEPEEEPEPDDYEERLRQRRIDNARRRRTGED